MFHQIFLIILGITPFAMSLVAPEPRPCTFDIFKHADNPALSPVKLHELKSKTLECLQKIRGARVTIQDASCNELMCAYKCATEYFKMVISK